ncbi:ATP-grasp domain-containing protein [Kineosporia rhizophila]|uniref:ATP-grasp domain-containing protein n=1 Tax=Kineosporia rhizophila TaxID=84633 RepID=UPI001E5EFFBD|nr:ATP-grasp domain-containing protein [Kineosporia rhizophila]MCE0539706.1 ATP-grasp domain-containing protein [Kineosporia rhizophila]
MLLFPADPLRPRRPDEHYAEEVAAAREIGLTVAFVDHDELTRPDGARAGVARVPHGAGEALYRGWMLTAQQYAGFEAALRERGVRLVTDAGQYRRAHELPGWYQALREVTPRAEWREGDTREAFDAARTALGVGAAVLRDYTKSAKHHWHEAAFIPDLQDAEAAGKVADRFRELRDEAFTGGYVLRQFEEFTSDEVRTWWVDGECRLVGAHPDTPQSLPSSLPATDVCTPLIQKLALRFVTLDLALRTDGVWRVIELGDGQVSDCPPALVPELVRQYAAAANR